MAAPPEDAAARSIRTAVVLGAVAWWLTRYGVRASDLVSAGVCGAFLALGAIEIAVRPLHLPVDGRRSTPEASGGGSASRDAARDARVTAVLANVVLVAFVVSAGSLGGVARATWTAGGVTMFALLSVVGALRLARVASPRRGEIALVATSVMASLTFVFAGRESPIVQGVAFAACVLAMPFAPWPGRSLVDALADATAANPARRKPSACMALGLVAGAILVGVAKGMHIVPALLVAAAAAGHSHSIVDKNTAGRANAPRRWIVSFAAVFAIVAVAIAALHAVPGPSGLVVRLRG